MSLKDFLRTAVMKSVRLCVGCGLRVVAMALRGLVKASDFQKIVDRTSVVNLYRNIIKELPRVMTIYDVDIPVVSARKAIRWHFDKNSHLKDGR